MLFLDIVLRRYLLFAVLCDELNDKGREGWGNILKQTGMPDVDDYSAASLSPIDPLDLSIPWIPIARFSGQNVYGLMWDIQNS